MSFQIPKLHLSSNFKDASSYFTNLKISNAYSVVAPLVLQFSSPTRRACS